MIQIANLIVLGSDSKISVKENAPFTRTDLAKELDKNKIGNRMFLIPSIISSFYRN